MRALLIAATLAGAALAGPVLADGQAGAPLAPADAAGPWTVQLAGQELCVIKLEATKTASGAYGLRQPADCGAALPANLTGWTPNDHGMTLIGQDGQPAMSFGRWSNSLLVSHRSAGQDVSLQRGVANP